MEKGEKQQKIEESGLIADIVKPYSTSGYVHADNIRRLNADKPYYIILWVVFFVLAILFRLITQYVELELYLFSVYSIAMGCALGIVISYIIKKIVQSFNKKKIYEKIVIGLENERYKLYNDGIIIGDDNSPTIYDYKDFCDIKIIKDCIFFYINKRNVIYLNLLFFKHDQINELKKIINNFNNSNNISL